MIARVLRWWRLRGTSTLVQHYGDRYPVGPYGRPRTNFWQQRTLPRTWERQR